MFGGIITKGATTFGFAKVKDANGQDWYILYLTNGPSPVNFGDKYFDLWPLKNEGMYKNVLSLPAIPLVDVVYRPVHLLSL